MFWPIKKTRFIIKYEQVKNPKGMGIVDIIRYVYDYNRSNANRLRSSKLNQIN